MALTLPHNPAYIEYDFSMLFVNTKTPLPAQEIL